MSQLVALAATLGQQLLSRGYRLATAESCTGGMVAAAVTEIAGSSAWFERGFVTYSNASKIELLAVAPASLDAHGAVSVATAEEMAQGALTHSAADWAISITGIAGPGGGSPGKPVGTVCFAWCQRGQVPSSETRHFDGDRAAVRQQAASHALQGLLARI